jgi:hypothetical protein
MTGHLSVPMSADAEPLTTANRPRKAGVPVRLVTFRPRPFSKIIVAEPVA